MIELETEILDAIKPLLAPSLEKLNSHKFDAQPGLLEVKCRQNEGEPPSTLLRLQTLHQQKKVNISSVNIPAAMKGHGLGKKLIKEIYIAAKAHGYEVFVTDMTPDFYQRLLRRGARLHNDDVVQINDDTVLA